jgi:hypothetical protein
MTHGGCTIQPHHFHVTCCVRAQLPRHHADRDAEFLPVDAQMVQAATAQRAAMA